MEISKQFRSWLSIVRFGKMVYIHAWEGSKVECDGWSTVRGLFVRFLIFVNFSTDRCTKKRKGVVFLFFFEYLKDKKSIYKDYYRSINFFFLLIWFFCKCSLCKCSLKKNLLSVILITRTNSFINLTIVFKTRFFEVGDQIDRKKLGKNIGIGIVNSEK